ncbi:hypothetical protein NEF87_004428 [Candidatus Lokiarchaeum ossiferum]|uniref:Uncharacterized protein n=1 Tax=Candidatus Lokiarchaeum ossiferum TaxID=2951803 RepID=A0ABY6HX88_9ARCH|nr:hypothetical protein NEF87_004428 [Candidatus Lokiarchaeum sp. B-35]
MVVSTPHIIMLAIVTGYIFFQYYFTIKLTLFLNLDQKAKSDKMVILGIFSLIFGDTIHIIYLYINYITDDIWLNGFGVVALIITSIFMSAYYLGLLFFTIYEYGSRKIELKHVIILLFFVVRVILSLLPQNNYAVESSSPTAVRNTSNVFFSIFGILTLLLFLSESQKRNLKADIIFKNVVIAGIISFACYIGHLILYPINPIFGMLMLPKSIAYNFEVYFIMKGIMSLREKKATSAKN